MKTYTQKKLGYPRQKTKARYCITLSNGEVWAIPAQIIVDNRDEYYKDEKEDTVKFIRNKELDEYEIEDWAKNNMNWADVKEYAEKVESGQFPDFEDE